MISAFHQALAHVKLLGSTQFEPVIERAAKIAALPAVHGEAHKYVAMIILTDGKFSDQKKIVEAMATVSNLPITFVYVVVGEDPDGENTKMFEKLKNDSRNYTNRDMIQVIQMHSLTNLSANARSFSIARQMIKELPSQLVTYYTSHNIFPTSPEKPFGVVSLLTPV
jgi:Copine